MRGKRCARRTVEVRVNAVPRADIARKRNHGIVCGLRNRPIGGAAVVGDFVRNGLMVVRPAARRPSAAIFGDAAANRAVRSDIVIGARAVAVAVHLRARDGAQIAGHMVNGNLAHGAVAGIAVFRSEIDVSRRFARTLRFAQRRSAARRTAARIAAFLDVLPRNPAGARTVVDFVPAVSFADDRHACAFVQAADAAIAGARARSDVDADAARARNVPRRARAAAAAAARRTAAARRSAARIGAFFDVLRRNPSGARTEVNFVPAVRFADDRHACAFVQAADATIARARARANVEPGAARARHVSGRARAAAAAAAR